MSTRDMRQVILMGIIVCIRADSIILRNDCMFENGECDIILETLTGSPERDCNILSTNQRTCSRNDTIKQSRIGPAKITIYDRSGSVILKWDKNDVDTEPQRKTGYVSHVVPKSEWNRPPIFWRRRKRQRGIISTCRCFVNAEAYSTAWCSMLSRRAYEKGVTTD